MDENNFSNKNNSDDDILKEFIPPSFIDEATRLQQKIQRQIEPIIEMQEKMRKLYQPIIVPQQELMKKYEPMLDAQQRIVSILGPYFEAQSRIQQTLEKVYAPLKNIDWEGIKEAAAERLKELDQLLREQENSNWCLDVDLMDSIDEGEIELKELSNHVDANLDGIVKELIAEPIFKLHTSLIDESYSAYKSGLYKLCAFSLFAAFEHVIASWYDGNLTKENISVDKKPKARKLYRRIESIAKNEKEQDEFIKVFALSVLRMYQKTFSFIPEQLNKELNRNSIAHGFHDYNSITKTDILKLFQLLKASTILELISVDELHEKNAKSSG
ncbi:hypothetical protein C1N70_24810 (plasmid) [Cytobacillus firmus]|uniref:hypothetical protein n=1 Tax=Bacillaceae TaxID=186817 RepID=UPI001A8CFB6D|nr:MULTISPECIES: hypothetical protein [Bacillaceae]MBN8203891.1 hypothetical protein [Bacillus sp. NTK034]